MIAAVLVGGTLISGGRGSAMRTLAGAIAIATISDVLLLRGFETGAQILLKGRARRRCRRRQPPRLRRQGVEPVNRGSIASPLRRLQVETVVPVLAFASSSSTTC